MRRLLHLWPASAALLGLLLVVWLIVNAGAEDVARSMLFVGWGLLPLALFHVAPLSLSALSWRGAAIRAAAFMVSGQMGILESSFVVFGALFGLPANAALAISFSRRVRELALGVP